VAFEYPSCSRPLYNRRHAACEFCGAVVLAELLLKPKQREAGLEL
jgi:hypothetical protein